MTLVEMLRACGDGISNEAADTIERLEKQVAMAKVLRGLPLDRDIADEDVRREQREMLEMLVCVAWKHVEISTGRAAECLGITIPDFRELAAKGGWEQSEGVEDVVAALCKLTAAAEMHPGRSCSNDEWFRWISLIQAALETAHKEMTKAGQK